MGVWNIVPRKLRSHCFFFYFSIWNLDLCTPLISNLFVKGHFLCRQYHFQRRVLGDIKKLFGLTFP